MNLPKCPHRQPAPSMRIPAYFRLPGLRLSTRLSIGVVLLVLGTTFAIATAALFMFKDNMSASIANEQFARLSAIADAVDQKFVSRHILLKSFGDSVATQHFLRATEIQAFLERHQSLKGAFDNVSFIDRGGNLVANLNGAQQIGRVNVKDRPYFIETVANKVSLISQPIRNRLNGLAQVVMTEPILGANGEVEFVMTGAINLQERNFLGELADVKFGKTGYLFILNTDGVMIEHPQKERILKDSNAPGGINLASRHALEGFEGTMESTGRDGVAALYSYKRISQTNWIVGARFPTSEAFQPVQQIERTAWLGALGMALLSGGIALAVLRRQLAPLGWLHHHMTAAEADFSHAPLVHNFNRDEIGDLWRAFSALMAQQQGYAEKLRGNERFLKNLADKLPILIAYIDTDERYRFVNTTFIKWTSADPLTVIGQRMEEVIGSQRYQQRLHQLSRALGGEQVDFEISVEAEGAPQYVQTSYVPDLRPDGSVAGVYCLATDVTGQKLVQASLDAIARVDSLTSLPNRREFENRLEIAMARTRRNKRPLALIYLDIDHFKQINDAHGHGIGDEVLKEFSFRLLQSIRVTDTAARLGGDEFVVILEGLSNFEEACVVAENLLAVITPLMHLSKVNLQVTSSMGFALFEGRHGTVEALLAKADEALYQAKAAGRNTYASTTF